MSQDASDVVIDNQGFAAFRQDLNNVLGDITTLHSGDTAPTTTYANQWWYETDADKLYIRNEDNDAWIEILTLDQANDHLATLGASITLDGTGNVSIDSGDFTVDTDTLHVDSTNNRVGVGTASPAYALDVQSTGDPAEIRLKEDGNTNGLRLTNYDGDEAQINNADNGPLVFKTNNTEVARLDASGRLGIGTTDPSSNTSTYYDDLVIKNDTSGTGAGITILSNSTNGFGAVEFRKADGTQVGKIYGRSSNGTVVIETGGTERVRFLSGGGMTFNGDSSSANALDDYEEGTWTPTLATGTATFAGAVYTKIGNVVTVSFSMSNFSDRTSGNDVQITNLPFNSSGAGSYISGGVMGRYVNSGGDSIVTYQGPNDNDLYFYTVNQNSGYASVDHNDLSSASAFFYVTHTYRSA